MPVISDFRQKLIQYFSLNFPRLYEFGQKNKSIIKFIIAGGLAGGTDLILLFVFHGLLKIEIVLSTSSAFILSFLVSFGLQKFWTFRNYCQDKVVQQLFLYIINALLGLYLNGLGMHLLVNKYALWYILAQIIVNLFLAVMNFIVYKFIIFKIGANETRIQ